MIPGGEGGGGMGRMLQQDHAEQLKLSALNEYPHETSLSLLSLLPSNALSQISSAFFPISISFWGAMKTILFSKINI
jgi:hypothetical protein